MTINRRQFLRSVAVSAAVLVVPGNTYGLLHSPEKPELVAWNMLEYVQITSMRFVNETMESKAIEVWVLDDLRSNASFIWSLSVAPAGLASIWLQWPIIIKNGWLRFTGANGKDISLDGLEWSFTTTEHCYTKKGVEPLCRTDN